jgi:hypothetical protein
VRDNDKSNQFKEPNRCKCRSARLKAELILITILSTQIAIPIQFISKDFICGMQDQRKQRCSSNFWEEAKQ